MSLYHTLASVLSKLVSAIVSTLAHIAAWRYDRMDVPENIRVKQRELMETVEHGARVLEVGAGTGNTLKAGVYEGSVMRFSQLVLSEPDYAMRSRIRTKLSGRATGVSEGKVSIVDAALPRLPFPDASFDVVAIFFVLSHVEDRVAAIREIARVLGASGKLLILDHGVLPHDHEHRHDHGLSSHNYTHHHNLGPSSHNHAHHHDHDHIPDHTPSHRNEHKSDFSSHVVRSHALWLFEWLRFKRAHSHSHGDAEVTPLENDLSQDPHFEKLFSSRMQVDYFFKEVMYGIFTRKAD